MLNAKPTTQPILQAIMEPLQEIYDKYAPLYELKMNSKIEGIDIGFE